MMLHRERNLLWLLQRRAKPCCTWCNYPRFYYLLCFNYYYSTLGILLFNSLQSQSMTALFHSLDYKNIWKKKMLLHRCWFLSSSRLHSWQHGQICLLHLNELPINLAALRLLGTFLQQLRSCKYQSLVGYCSPKSNGADLLLQHWGW